MSYNGAGAATAARRKLAKLKAINDATKTHPKRLYFGLLSPDFLVTMLFEIGMESEAIANHTGLTRGQVEYRARRYEWDQRQKAKREGKRFFTARKQYRKGVSPVCKMLISQIQSSHSQIKKYVAGVLDKRGLSPKSTGVLRNDERERIK